METLFIEFRDPLFGVIVFFVLVFVIAFFSYWWGRYRTKEEHRDLDRFIRQFHALPSERELKGLIESGHISHKSWLLLAQSYVQNGDFERSIEIYQTLVERLEDPKQRLDTMFLLGQTYFKAGFLERSKALFMEILKRQPRSAHVLRYLLLVYEQLKAYDKAIEVLEPLDELDKDIRKDRLYLECAALLQNPDLDAAAKGDRLIAFYREHHAMGYMVFSYLFAHMPHRAWEHLDHAIVERIADVLWGLTPEQCDLDIISRNGYLRELFSAKGIAELSDGSAVFELDVLIGLHRCGRAGATLQFEYLCRECKQVFPFAFHRCPNCYAIDSVMSEPMLTKEWVEEDFAFQ